MATFNDILDRIDEALAQFNKNIPASQQAMYEELAAEIARLDQTDGKIKQTVANLKVVASIKNKMLKLILTDDYLGEVKGFVQAFRDVTALQNEYWKGMESKFKPRSILKEIRTQAIDDTVGKLTDAGIGINIGDTISGILNTNITAGGSIKDLTAQVKEVLVDTESSPGLLSRYAKQITTDSINQYNATYTQTVSSDLGFEWYAYQGSDIKTTRPFCDAMTDRRYFHVSEIPRLLAAEGLEYKDQKTGEVKPVPIYDKTGLPQGMIPGTNPENFFIRRGGYNCGHQIRPVSERVVPQARKTAVYATPEYQAWKAARAA